jgi:fatty-acyl-CoA synthase
MRLDRAGRRRFRLEDFDENTAAGMCYTSGTTGDPKGVLYSHRSNVLHSLMANTKATRWALSARDTMLPVVPMFHANAWGIAFSAPMMGAKLVMPGPSSTAPRSTNCWRPRRSPSPPRVPTVWLMLLQPHGANRQAEAADLEAVVIGGSAMPRSMIKAFEDDTASRCATPGA